MDVARKENVLAHRNTYRLIFMLFLQIEGSNRPVNNACIYIKLTRIRKCHAS